MKNFTKLMLTLVLALPSAGSANATKVYADLSKLSNGPVSTWDGATSTMTWTALSNNMISNFDYAAGNYRACTAISITVSDLNNAVGIRLQIKANGQEKLVALNGEGTFTKFLIDDFGFTAADLTKVEWIRLLGSTWGDSHTIDAEHPASAVISNVYLEQPTRTLDVNLSKMAAKEGNATWDSSTNKFAWTGTWSNAITLPGLSGVLSSFTNVSYEAVAGTCDHFRILVYYSNGAPQTTYQASVGKKNIALHDMGVATENLAHVSSIKVSGANDMNGDITLNRFSLEGPLVNYIEKTTVQVAPEGVTDLNGMTGADNNKWSIAYPLTAGDGTQFGGNIDGDNRSVNIEDYEYLIFVVSDASNDAKAGLRVFVSTESSSDNSTRVILYPHPVADYNSVSDWTAQSFITAPGNYIVKISDYPLLRGVKNLAYWQGSAGTISISQAYLGSGTPVVPTEDVVLVGTEALADANATCFDVTSLTETGLSYNPANPNALFLSNAGQMTNTRNVIVGNTCANLVLTDGHPFKAPKDFTATAATYTTTLNATAKAGTLVLPFNAALPEGVTAYTLGDVASGKVKATSVDAIEADKPVLTNGEGEKTFTGAGVAVAATADEAVANGALGGVYQNTNITSGYVLQNQNGNVGFYRVAAATTVKPFRAYLNTQNADARISIVYDGDEETGINRTENGKLDIESGVYDLQGRRIDGQWSMDNGHLTKGIYVKNGKKHIVK